MMAHNTGGSAMQLCGQERAGSVTGGLTTISVAMCGFFVLG